LEKSGVTIQEIGEAVIFLKENKFKSKTIDEEIKQEKSMAEEKTGKEENKKDDEIVLNLFSNFKCDQLTYFRYELTKFMIENSLSYKLAPKLAMLINSLTLKINFNTLKEVTAQDNHLRSFSKAISSSLQKKYLNDLCMGPYSVAIDAAAAQSGEEYLALNARYFLTATDSQTTTKLLALLHLKGAQTGEKIALLLSNYLFSGDGGEIRKKNMIGISSDGAKNMISSRGAGATNRISVEIPLLIISYDICHALNLVMKKCIATFPKKYINIITEISSIFSYSGVKTAELQEIMEKKGTKPLKILRYVPTR
jgi:hypothetical protein